MHAPNGQRIVLDRPRLVTMLRAIEAAPSVSAVRQAVEDVRAELTTGALLDQGTADPVTCSVPHLAADLDQIQDSQTVDRARYYAARLTRAVTEVRSSALNDLNLNRWKEYDDIHTDSLWIVDRRDGSGVHRADYWGNFVPQIPNQLMRRFTRPGDWVLDPFVGAGTTLIEAQRLGRNCLGVELQPGVAALARSSVAQEPNEHAVETAVLEGDSTAFDFTAALAERGVAEAQLAILHPPYADIIQFSDDPRDLSNAPSHAAFLEKLNVVVGNVAPLIGRGRHLALVIGDTYARGEWTPLGFMAMQHVLEQPFRLKSILVKNIEQTAGKRRQRDLWRYRALAGGFYLFKHEYIFLFQKR